MLDLELKATLFRAIDWQQIGRLILVGDSGQLPPIRRSLMFANMIKWLASKYPSTLGRLQKNLSLLTNKIEAHGRAIMTLSELFVVDDEEQSPRVGRTPHHVPIRSS